LLWVGLPMSISLSTMHSFLPPHPGPVAAAGIYEASTGRTILFGFAIAVIAGVIVAMIWPRLPFVKKMNPSIPEVLAHKRMFEEDETPDTVTTIGVAILPIIIIGGAEIYALFANNGSTLGRIISMVGAPEVAVLITLFVDIIFFVSWRGTARSEIAASMSD